MTEINVNGITGFLSDVGDIEDMARNTLIVLDPANHDKFKQDALKRAKEFDLKFILPLYVNYYQEVIEKAKALAL